MTDFGDANPIADLAEDWVDLKDGFDSDSPPLEYWTRYADFSFKAEVTTCRIGVSADAKEAVKLIQRDARPRFRTWLRVHGYCAHAEDCVMKTLAQTKQEIAGADSRDVTVANADALMRQVVVPKKQGWFSSFRPAPYEDNLGKLLRIQDAIEIAKMKRESDARAIVALIESDVQKSEETLANARRYASRSGRMLQCEQKAKAAVAGINSTVETLIPELQRALELSSTVSIAVVAMKARVESLRAGAADIVVSPARPTFSNIGSFVAACN